MSKLAKAVEAYQSGDKRAAPNYTSFSHDSAKMPNSDMFVQTKYRLEAKFGATVWIDDNVKGSMDRVQWALEDVRKSIVEEVFGEFRGILNDMRVANHQSDSDRMRTLISELEYKMFVEGI